jgi:hypothetical protein
VPAQSARQPAFRATTEPETAPTARGHARRVLAGACAHALRAKSRRADVDGGSPGEIDRRGRFSVMGGAVPDLTGVVPSPARHAVAWRAHERAAGADPRRARQPLRRRRHTSGAAAELRPLSLQYAVPSEYATQL